MIYKDFIQNILNTRGRFACGEEYHERHHILPKCMGGSNDEENLIDLYAKEHYEAHKLLALENPDEKRLQYALYCMCLLKNDKTKERYIVSSDEYEQARILFNKINVGHVVSKETREKISNANTGKFSGVNNPFYGHKHTQETKEKIRKSMTGKRCGEDSPNFGKVFSEKTKEKLSISHKGLLCGENNPNAKKVVCEGIIFNTIQDCAKHYNVSFSTIYTYLSCPNRMSKKWIDMGLDYFNKEVKYD